jgi:hypothetical protein
LPSFLNGLFPLLIIPDQANHCNEHGHDRPGGNASNQNEEQELSDIIPACFCAEEFTAYFVKGRRPRNRPTGGGTHLSFRCWMIVVIR